MLKNFTSFVIALIAWSAAFAGDGKGSIKASLKDKNNQPLPYANITLINSLDGKVAKQATSNEDGKVYLNSIPEGEYHLSISHLGFNTLTIDHVVVVEGITTTLDEMVLESDTQMLSEVEVVGDIGVTKIEPGKILYKVSDLPSQNGGTAGDILKNMPSVAMGGSPNHNRDIRLRGLGNGYTQVLINGRVSGITGNNRETVLDQIPASSVEYIEIITNPSAEFQADGINGIVNIVLKKGIADDVLRGNVSFMVDNYDGYNGSAGLSLQKEKYEFSLQYDKLERTINNDKEVEKINFKEGNYDGTQFTDQREIKNFINENFRIAGKFRPWKSGTLSTSFVYGKQLEVKNKNIEILTTKADDSFKDRSFRTEPESRNNRFQEYFTEFKQVFSNQSVLDISFSAIKLNQPNHKHIHTQGINEDGTYKGEPKLQNDISLLRDKNYFANLNYSLPLGQANKLKAGYRLASLSRNLDNRLEEFNHKEGGWATSQRNDKNFLFNENTHAFYLVDELKWRFIKLNAGLRFEHSQVSTISPVDNLQKDSDYSFLLPNVSGQFNLNKTQYITVSMGKRLRRPAFGDLSPFVDDRDPQKVKQGNPDLQPEYSWNYEIGYLKNFKNVNFGVNLFHREIRNLIQKMITEDDNNILYEKPDNFAGAYLKGVELMTSANIAKWWTANASYSFFDSQINDPFFDGDAIKDQMRFMAKVISDFKLPFLINAQVAFNYLGDKPSLQDSQQALHFLDLGLEKSFLTNGNLMFRVSDVLDTVVKKKTKNTDKSVQHEIENTWGRIINAGVRWNF